jgi:MFS family permease
VPEFLQTPPSAGYGFGASITRSGLVLLPLSGTLVVAVIMTCRFASRFGSKVPLVAGSVFSGAGMLIPAIAHGSEGEFYASMALVGLGIGFAFSAMSNLVVEAVPAHQTGVATGMNANVRTIGGAIGSTVVASIISSSISGGLPGEHGYELSFIVLGAGMGLAGVAAAFVPSLAQRTASARALQAHAGGEEFGELAVEPSIVGPAEAGLAIGEHLPR